MIVRAGLVERFDAFLRTLPHLDVDALRRNAGMPPARLDDDAVVDLRPVHRLFADAAEAAGDPALGLRFAGELAWKDLGVLGYVLVHSPTLGAALANLCRYLAVQTSAGRTHLDVDGGVATISYTVEGLDRAPPMADLVLAMVVRLCRDGVGRPAWAPREVHLRHRAPASTAAHDRFFAAPVRFGQADDAVRIAAADLAAPMQTADAALLPILLRHAEECLARMPAHDDLAGAVRRAIAAALRDDGATIQAVAAVLDTSARSLQRRLQGAGHSFSDLVAETRLALARQYLGDPSLSLVEIAFLLGYADQSAFSRAFRRWTGETALEVRRRAEASQAGARGGSPARGP